jgi:hypothetical protein
LPTNPAGTVEKQQQNVSSTNGPVAIIGTGFLHVGNLKWYSQPRISLYFSSSFRLELG